MTAPAGIVSLTGDTKAVWGLLTSSWLNLLLLSVPLGYAAHFLNWSPIARFSLVRFTPRYRTTFN